MISCKEYADFKKTQIKEAPAHMELSIVQVGDDPGSAAYVRGKIKDCNEVGIKSYLYQVSDTITQNEVADVVTKAALNGGGIMITMPLPSHLHVRKEWFKPWQDVDGLCYDYYSPCTAEGIMNWLDFNDFDFENSHVVVVGRGKLVGHPLAEMLIKAGATVTVCNSHTSRQLISALVQQADVIVSATGHKDWFDGWLDSRKKRLWIDAGINVDEKGHICGDLDATWLTACGQKVTPVPGGVGLLTRVTLLEHLTGKEF